MDFPTTRRRCDPVCHIEDIDALQKNVVRERWRPDLELRNVSAICESGILCPFFERPLGNNPASWMGNKCEINLVKEFPVEWSCHCGSALQNNGNVAELLERLQIKQHRGLY